MLICCVLGIFTACNENGVIDNENNNQQENPIDEKDNDCQHEYLETIVNPTCTEQGYTLHACKKCSHNYKDNFTDALGHDYVWTTTKQPTETAKGTETGICSRCKDTITRDIPELNHEHSYTETIVAPTCTAKGYTLHKCSCGYEYRTDETEKIPHTPLAAVEENRIEAKCEESGSYDSVVYCAVCGTELSREHKVLNAIEHDYGDWIETTPPTCTTKGVETRYCSHDNTHTETRDIPKLQHEFTNYVSDNNATYDADGTKTAYCNHGCGAKDTVTDVGTKLKSGIAFKTLSVDGNNIRGKVANNVTTYSFINEITTTGNVTYSVSYDINGNYTIPSKTSNINEGDNIFYILEKVNGEVTNLFTVNVRRREIYDVTFNANGGTAVDPQRIEEDDFATEPTTTRAGYTFTEWDYTFGNPITSNTVITASWVANTDTKYKAEYYLQNLDDDNYTLDFTDNLTGETDKQATAEIKTYNHYTFNESKSIVSGNINGDETTVLKVYYSRDVYVFTVINENTKGGSIDCTENGGYRYNTQINLSATVNDGYDFVGWFYGDTKISAELEYSFAIIEKTDITAKYLAHNNTKYIVETYLENLDGNYTKQSTEEHFGETDTFAVVTPAIREHYSLNESKSVLSGNINGNAGTILTVYYLRNKYNVYIQMQDEKISISTTYNDSYKYGYPINAISVTSLYLGYDFTGWYDEENLQIESDTISSFTVDREVNLVARYAVKQEMKNMEFTSTLSDCVVTGFVDKTVQQITIPEYVNEIADAAFSGCGYLTRILVNENNANYCSVSGVLYNKTKTQIITIPVSLSGDIEIPNGLTSISDSAFAHRHNIKSVTIPESIANIGESVFANCSSLETVNWNATNCKLVDSYDSPVFYGCKVKTMNILPHANYIPLSLFYKCSFLTNINVSEDNEYYKSIDGNLYSKNGQTLIKYAVAKQDKTLTITDNVTRLEDSALRDCYNLREIYISDSVTEIGVNLLTGCSYLQKLRIPFIPQNESIKIDKYDCNHIGYYFGGELVSDQFLGTKFKYSSGDTKYYEADIQRVSHKTGASSVFAGSTKHEYVYKRDLNYAYSEYYSISTYYDFFIPSSLKNITVGSSCSAYAFSGCKNVTDIEFENGVTYIGNYAFKGCSNLNNVTIPDSVGYVGIRAFNGCSCTTVQDGLTYFNKWLVDYDDSLTEINIKEGTPIIPDYAFYEFKTLRSVTIPDSVTSIGRCAFADCEWLSDVALGNGITEIGICAFEECYTINNLIIPEGVTIIGDYAFNYCGALTLTLPSTVSSIGEYAFGVTSKVQKIIYTGNARQWAQIDKADVGNVYINNKPISEITEVDLDGFTEIKDNAFRGFRGLTSIIIPDGVTSIGDDAFSDCCRLVEVVNKSNINIQKGSNDYGRVGYYALTVHNGESKIINNGGYLFITIEGINYLCGYIGSDTVLTLPSDYNGENYQIYKYAFYYCSALTSIIIPYSVTSIGDYAFSGCGSIKSIEIPDSVTSIGSWAFTGCKIENVTIPTTAISYFKNSYLKTVVITNGESVENGAFSGCSNLTSVTIGNSVKSIGSKAFSGCSNLTSLTIPFIGGSKKTANETYQYPFGYIFGTSSYTGSTATKQYYYGSSTTSETNTTYYIPSSLKFVTVTGGDINYGAFYNCSSLTSITLANGVTSIGNIAFSWCERLTEISISDTVTTIGVLAFEHCRNLKDIVIPNSVISIGGSAFYDCNKLTNMTIPFVGAQASLTLTSSSSCPLGYLFGTNSFAGGVATKQYKANTIATYYIPSSLKSVTVTGNTVLDGAFYGCSGLTSITLCDKVTNIGSETFYGCSGLTNIVIPNLVTVIGSYAFKNCSELNSITLGANISVIANSSFAGCGKLTSVYYRGKQDNWSKISIYEDGNSPLLSATIYYYSATAPTDTSYNYWRYDSDGNIVVW